MFGFFLHGILFKTFDDGLFGHESGYLVFEIGLSGISQ